MGILRIAVVLSLAVVAACSKSRVREPAAEPAAEVAEDAGAAAADSDAGGSVKPTDTPRDAAPPSTPTQALDAGMPPDAALDATDASAVTDAASDAASDAATDAGVDAGADECMRNSDGSDDCPAGFWCRSGPSPLRLLSCVPFVGEDELCGGWVELPERCAPELGCTNGYPANNDGPGRCRLRCSGDADCGDGRYCSTWFGLCFDDGRCLDSLDCDEPGNDYARDDCTGYGTCAAGSCSFACGDAACRDIGNIDIGHCLVDRAYAVLNGACTRVNRCDARGVTLYDSMAACTDACMP